MICILFIFLVYTGSHYHCMTSDPDQPTEPLWNNQGHYSGLELIGEGQRRGDGGISLQILLQPVLCQSSVGSDDGQYN